MPTGYTADVQSGKITEFPEFALQCARAFGALIMMRDDPMDKPIPDQFEPSSHYDMEVTQRRDRLAKLRSMTIGEAETEAGQAHRRALAEYERRCDERETHLRRYETMLEKARAWQPPTEEHVGLRDFMVEQLTESIAFDTRYEPERPVQKTGAGWLAEQVEEAERSLRYYEKARQEEIDRTNSRNKWVADLRASLAGSPS